VLISFRTFLSIAHLIDRLEILFLENSTSNHLDVACCKIP